jgi:site-specific DNA-methyltransferase (adenine-specific)
MATYLLGDCIPTMKTLPDKSVDCFICDLPYGQLATPGHYAGGVEISSNVYGTGCPWDVKLNLADFWTEVKRLCKNEHTPVLMFCNTKFGYELIKSNEKWFRYDLVWNKERGISFLSVNKMPLKSHEMIYVFSKAGAHYNRIDVMTDKKGFKRSSETYCRQYNCTKRKNGEREDGTRCVLSVITSHTRTVTGHPTEKPEELYEWLLKRYVPEGGTVLDPTAGSFNSIRVAKRLGLKGIGIEKDRSFFWKAVGFHKA